MTTLPDNRPRCNLPHDLSPDWIAAESERLAPLDCPYSAVIILEVYRVAYLQLYEVSRREIETLRAELAARNPLDCGRCDDVLVWQDPAPMTSEAYRRLIREV